MSIVQPHGIVPCPPTRANEEVATAIIGQMGRPPALDRYADVFNGDREFTINDLAGLCEHVDMPLTITVGSVTVVPAAEDDPPLYDQLVDVLPHELWYGRQRYTMQPPIVDRHHFPGDVVEVNGSSAWQLRAAVEIYGRSLSRENRYDTPTALADSLGQRDLVLLHDSGTLASAALVSSALGFSRLSKDEHASFAATLEEPDLSEWLLTWAYTHPFMRGRREARALFRYARTHYGRFAVHGPFSSSGAAFARAALGDDLHLLTGPGAEQVRSSGTTVTERRT